MHSNAHNITIIPYIISINVIMVIIITIIIIIIIWCWCEMWPLALAAN